METEGLTEVGGSFSTLFPSNFHTGSIVFTVISLYIYF